MKNEKVLIDELMESYKSSVIDILAKFDKMHDKLNIPKIKRMDVESGNDMFIELLKAIGRPAMTREIFARFKKIHPEIKFAKNNKKLMQKFYSSASFLSKNNIITRNLVDNNSYEYSLIAA